MRLGQINCFNCQEYGTLSILSWPDKLEIKANNKVWGGKRHEKDIAFSKIAASMTK